MKSNPLLLSMGENTVIIRIAYFCSSSRGISPWDSDLIRLLWYSRLFAVELLGFSSSLFPAEVALVLVLVVLGLVVIVVELVGIDEGGMAELKLDRLSNVCNLSDISPADSDIAC